MLSDGSLDYPDEVLEELDVDSVGEFVEMASTLLEIKSRMILPRGGEEVEEVEAWHGAVVPTQGVQRGKGQRSPKPGAASP